MPTRSVSYRNFGLSVTVPDRVAAAARRIRGSAAPAAATQTGLRYIDPPPVPNVTLRDPKHSLDFRDVAEEEGSRQQELVGPQGDDDLSAQIKSQTWYHTIELPDGVVTPGQFDHRPLMARYPFPASLEGKRALDAATFNGYWAFAMEKLGADVVAIDLDDPADWDFPEPVRKELLARGPRDPIGTGFQIAHKALDSKVQRVSRSLYDLNPGQDGMFDLVHCSDVLLHLREPLRALERMRDVCSGDFILTDVIDIEAEAGRLGPTMQYLGGWHDVNWWIPSLDVLVQLVIDAGFNDVQVKSVFNLPKTYEPEGLWRVSLTAR